MKVTLLDTVKLPTYAICYVEYGDATGMEAEDIANTDEWLAQYDGRLHFEYGDEPHFASCPEFGLACDVVDCKVYKLS